VEGAQVPREGNWAWKEGISAALKLQVSNITWELCSILLVLCSTPLLCACTSMTDRHFSCLTIAVQERLSYPSLPCPHAMPPPGTRMTWQTLGFYISKWLGKLLKHLKAQETTGQQLFDLAKRDMQLFETNWEKYGLPFSSMPPNCIPILYIVLLRITVVLRRFQRVGVKPRGWSFNCPREVSFEWPSS